jgi:hypothetical protein
VVVAPSPVFFCLNKDARIAGFDPDLSLVPLRLVSFPGQTLSTVKLLLLLLQQSLIISFLHVRIKHVLEKADMSNPARPDLFPSFRVPVPTIPVLEEMGVMLRLGNIDGQFHDM